MKKVTEKPIIWIGPTLKDLKEFPEDVKDVVGYSLDAAQRGEKADNVKPLSSIVKGGRIFEVIDDYYGDTYRAVYTVKFEKAIYALHAFKKKSKSGIATPKPDIDVIKVRYKRAELHYKVNYSDK